MKVHQTLSKNLTKSHSIYKSFSWSKAFNFYKILSHFLSLMIEIFLFAQISKILSKCINLLSLFLLVSSFGTVVWSGAETSLSALRRLAFSLFLFLFASSLSSFLKFIKLKNTFFFEVTWKALSQPYLQTFDLAGKAC